VDNKLAIRIRVVDKQRPETSYFSAAHKAIFDNKRVVDYVQADLTNVATVTKIFTGMQFDYVFNCCGETRFGLSDADYKMKCLDTAVKCATAAAKAGVKKFVELSTAQVYDPSEKPANEDAKLSPWTVQASYRLKAEQELAKIPGLNLVVLRPAIVYGPADLTGLSPRIVVAAVYKKSGKVMKFLWGESLRLNTVHVDDVCAAMWSSAIEAKPGSTYNLADDVDLSQGVLTSWLGSLFQIKTDFFGKLVSNVVKLGLQSLASDANNEHIPIWDSICREHGIANTPLSPYIAAELLSNTSLCIDGTKITKELPSFKSYKHRVSEVEVKNQIDFFVAQGIFPKMLGPPAPAAATTQAATASASASASPAAASK